LGWSHNSATLPLAIYTKETKNVGYVGDYEYEFCCLIRVKLTNEKERPIFMCTLFSVWKREWERFGELPLMEKWGRGKEREGGRKRNMKKKKKKSNLVYSRIYEFDESNDSQLLLMVVHRWGI